MTAAKSPIARYAVATVLVVVVIGFILSLMFRGPGDITAICLSGIFAVVVQLGAFSLARMVGQGNLTARMGVGALVRFMSLMIYAFLVALVFKLPLVAALLSLFLFFFLSTLIEPILIRS